jgi:hypothetical protein
MAQYNALVPDEQYEDFATACKLDNRTITGMLLQLTEDFTNKMKKKHGEKFNEKKAEMAERKTRKKVA